MIFTRGGLVIFAARKCATQSLDATMSTIDEFVEGKRTVALVRDPVERAASGFRCFYGWKHDDLHVSSWEIWVDRVLTGCVNDHWTPQADCIDPSIIDEWWPFEELPSLWPFSFPPLPHKNVSKCVPFDVSYRLTELKQYYARDYALRSFCGY